MPLFADFEHVGQTLITPDSYGPEYNHKCKYIVRTSHIKNKELKMIMREDIKDTNLRLPECF
jgi:hypothetical protein